MALNKRGEMIGTAFNRSRFPHHGGGIHAEMHLMKRYGKQIKTIIICRVNKSGDMLPIEPCDICAEKATELGIKIVSLKI